MTVTAPARRPSVAARRTGYVIAVAVNLLLIYLIDVWPGWSAVPFLTDETRQVIGLVTFSMAASAAVNLVYLMNDAPLVKAVGDVLTTGIGLAVLVRLVRVFPFTGYTVDWTLVVRILLWVGLVGSAIGLVVQVVTLVRLAAGRPVMPGRSGT
jgi:hypothetical protein